VSRTVLPLLKVAVIIDIFIYKKVVTLVITGAA